MTRHVHLADGFLQDVVRHFRAEQGPNGEPSSTDFVDSDLENIKFVFAEMWDVLDWWQGHPTYRFRYFQGVVAYRYYVVAQERSDGSIELSDLGVDHEWPEEMN